MNELSEYILSDFQRRNSYEEKTRFIERIREKYPEIKIEEKRKTRNIVFGDPETAEYVFTGHYDTCSVLPFPNLLFVNNIAATILVSILICVPLFLISGVLDALLMMAEAPPWTVLLSTYTLLILFIWWVYLGPASSHTANDNTSGTLTVLELYDAMPAEHRKRCAFVLFDNEEKGLIGSRVFLSMHREAAKRFTLINFDCVSDGDDIMLIFPRTLYGEMKEYEECFRMPGKRFLPRKASNTMYPSDQKGFANGIGAVALHHCVLGFYVPRIHTKRDVIFDRNNIEFLVNGSLRLSERSFSSEGT